MTKIKEFSKKYLIGFTLGLITSGIVVVCAATYFPSNQTTYDNSVSGLNATNVQGAIDELYNTCFPPTLGDQILENTDLEKDPYECRYFFTGKSPNNYITFNGENAGWRIISVECDGTIKIMRTAHILGNQYWDVGTDRSNNWAKPAYLNTYLNRTYYNSLNNTAQSQIISKDWSIGSVTYDNNDLENQINDENSSKWNGKVALVTVSEYLRSNSNKNSCGSFSLNNDNYSSCINTGWIDNNIFWWTLSPLDGNSNYAFNVGSDGIVRNDVVYSDGSAVRPVVYLSSEVNITGGNGSQSNPYTIK